MTTLTIGQVARAARVNVQTIRFYEREGILAAPRRSRSGYRQYAGDTVRVVSFIKRAQELGFTLREARELLKLRAAGPARKQAVRKAAEAKVADLERRIRDLRAIKDALGHLVSECAHSGGGVACPILEALEREES
jgi:MerR family copper efflux transcriptional regulator